MDLMPIRVPFHKIILFHYYFIFKPIIFSDIIHRVTIIPPRASVPIEDESLLVDVTHI